MRYSATAILALLAFSAACSDSSTMPEGPNQPDDALNSDIAAVAVQAASEVVGSMSDLTNLEGLGSGALVMPNGRPDWFSDCTFDGQSWTCQHTRDNGIEVTRVITLHDATGAVMEGYDRELTASVDVVADVSGEVETDRWSGVVDRHRELIWTGLAGIETTRTVNGTGNGEVTRTRFTSNGDSRTYDLSSVFTLADVVIPVGPGDHWPISGTATRTFTITRPDGTVVVRTVVIIFNGTASPEGTVDGEPYTFDLTARRAFPRG